MDLELLDGRRHSSAYMSPVEDSREPPPPPAPGPPPTSSTSKLTAGEDTELALASLSLSCRREELEARLRGADSSSYYVSGQTSANLRRRAAGYNMSQLHSSTQQLLASSRHSLDFDLDGGSRYSSRLEVPAIRRQKSAEYYRTTSFDEVPSQCNSVQLSTDSVFDRAQDNYQAAEDQATILQQLQKSQEALNFNSTAPIPVTSSDILQSSPADIRHSRDSYSLSSQYQQPSPSYGSSRQSQMYQRKSATSVSSNGNPSFGNPYKSQLDQDPRYHQQYQGTNQPNDPHQMQTGHWNWAKTNDTAAYQQQQQQQLSAELYYNGVTQPPQQNDQEYPQNKYRSNEQYNQAFNGDQLRPHMGQGLMGLSNSSRLLGESDPLIMDNTGAGGKSFWSKWNPMTSWSSQQQQQQHQDLLSRNKSALNGNNNQVVIDHLSGQPMNKSHHMVSLNRNGNVVNSSSGGTHCPDSFDYHQKARFGVSVTLLFYHYITLIF